VTVAKGVQLMIDNIERIGPFGTHLSDFDTTVTYPVNAHTPVLDK